MGSLLPIMDLGNLEMVAAELGQAVAAEDGAEQAKKVSRGQLLSATIQKLLRGQCIDMLINMLYNMYICYIICVKNGVTRKNCCIAQNYYITCYITVFGDVIHYITYITCDITTYITCDITAWPLLGR